MSQGFEDKVEGVERLIDYHIGVADRLFGRSLPADNGDAEGRIRNHEVIVVSVSYGDGLFCAELIDEAFFLQGTVCLIYLNHFRVGASQPLSGITPRIGGKDIDLQTFCEEVDFIAYLGGDPSIRREGPVHV